MELVFTFLAIIFVAGVTSNSTKHPDNLHAGINKHLLEDIKRLTLSNNIVVDRTDYIIANITGKGDTLKETDPSKNHELQNKDGKYFKNINKQAHSPDIKNTQSENSEEERDEIKQTGDRAYLSPEQELETSNIDENEEKAYVNKGDIDIDESDLEKENRIKSSRKTEILHSTEHNVPLFPDKENGKSRDNVKTEIKGDGMTHKTEFKEELKENISDESDKSKPKLNDHKPKTDKQTQKETKGESYEKSNEDKKVNSSHQSEHDIPKHYNDKSEQLPPETKTGKGAVGDQEELKKEMVVLKQDTEHVVKEQSRVQYNGTGLKPKNDTLLHSLTKPANQHGHVRVNISDTQNFTTPIPKTIGNIIDKQMLNEHPKKVIKPETISDEDTGTKSSEKAIISKFTTSRKESSSIHTTMIKEKLKNARMRTQSPRTSKQHLVLSTTNKEVTENKVNIKSEKLYKTTQQQKHTVTKYATVSATLSKRTNGNSLSFSPDKNETIKKPENKAEQNRNMHLNHKPYTTTTNTKQTRKMHRTSYQSEKTPISHEKSIAEHNSDDERTPEDPCQGRNDPSLQYTGSAVVAATVGGVFVGAFAVVLLFHLRQKCRKYVNGDYRRVPMEYDFELNPRFKSH